MACQDCGKPECRHSGTKFCVACSTIRSKRSKKKSAIKIRALLSNKDMELIK